ncbi:adenylosuccinate lyase [Spiroplasma endosymbiont of Aspidapion aeneum]|uniref:adenylosuccinate lyase n=1 Tax=Spiroplasma endosymbiont of Aspidapion aeneum TaxID=3066276 RepID=UPI00313C12B3
MIERYSIKEIEQFWSNLSIIKTWWLVEHLVLKAWNKLNVIPSLDLDRIEKNVKINLKRMLEIEQLTKHDVIAFTRMVSESLGEEKKWIHLGLTSTDIVDTSQNFLIKKSYEVYKKDLKKLMETIKEKALEHKNTFIMGRSHGIFGEPTSFGLKFLLWYDELRRQEKRLDMAILDVCVTKISGSMGNFTNLEIEIEEYVAKHLDMPCDLISTQVSQRDRLASLFLSYANYASTLEKISTEIRLLHRSDVGEVSEGFSAMQKGSSSMPHKKNPIGSENITGLARLLRSYANISLENNILWHERDISHSSNERIIIPDSINIATFMTRRLNSIISNLNIDKKQMLKNIDSSNKIYYSQILLTEIIKTTKHSREEIYDFIQVCSNKCLKEKRDFLDIVKEENNGKFINNSNIDKIANINIFLKNVDRLYKRVLK